MDAVKHDFLDGIQDIIIVGDCATGKTFLATKIARQAINKGTSAVYTTEEDLLFSARRQKAHWHKILHSDLIVLDELFYLKPSEENLQLLYRTVMFLAETRSFIFITNRPLSEWDNMGVDKHTVSTFRQRIMAGSAADPPGVIRQSVIIFSPHEIITEMMKKSVRHC